jgi:hypothetical protein
MHGVSTGTHPDHRSRRGLGITIPNVISTGTETSTATGVATKSFANGTTTAEIQNVGTLYLHRVIEKDHHIEVRMIELVISVPVGPLAVGTDIRIGVAEVSVHSG